MAASAGGMRFALSAVPRMSSMQPPDCPPASGADFGLPSFESHTMSEPGRPPAEGESQETIDLANLQERCDKLLSRAREISHEAERNDRRRAQEERDAVGRSEDAPP